jgi:GntR family transcriptional regulator
MLYVGLEPASEHVAACLRVEPGTEVIARRKMMFANSVPVRIATSVFRPTCSATPGSPSQTS